ncbi:MAG: cytochrome c biogenesis protein ResB [Armatimonadota bacterium]
MSIDTETRKSIEEQEPNLLRALWALFSSMKTAITLLLLLAVLSILGTVIQQNGMPEEYLNIYGAQKYAFFHALGLTDVYHSGWYKLLLLLVGVNLAVCSINRFGITRRQARQPKVFVPSDAITKMQRSEKLSSRQSVKDSAEKVAASLRAGRYHVSEERDGDDVAFVASKGAWSLWGPYLTHLSILVIFVGAVYGSLFGFEGYTAITEGQSTSAYAREGSNKMSSLGFRVALNDFRVEYDTDHTPTAYTSDLRIYEGDKLVARKVIDVNHPLTYRGISFHQSDYGMDSLMLKVTDPKGKSEHVTFGIETVAGPMGKQFTLGENPFKEIKIGGRKVTIFAHDFTPDYAEGHEVAGSDLSINPAVMLMANDRFPEYKGLDAWSNLGWLERSKPVKYKNLTIEIENAVESSGLQVSSNPGLYVIYAGFALLLLGIFLSFYVQRMILRARVSATSKGSVVVIGATCRAGTEAFDNDFRRLRDAFLPKTIKGVKDE